MRQELPQEVALVTVFGSLRDILSGQDLLHKAILITRKSDICQNSISFQIRRYRFYAQDR